MALVQPVQPVRTIFLVAGLCFVLFTCTLNVISTTSSDDPSSIRTGRKIMEISKRADVSTVTETRSTTALETALEASATTAEQAATTTASASTTRTALTQAASRAAGIARTVSATSTLASASTLSASTSAFATTTSTLAATTTSASLASLTADASIAATVAASTSTSASISLSEASTTTSFAAETIAASEVASTSALISTAAASASQSTLVATSTTENAALTSSLLVTETTSLAAMTTSSSSSVSTTGNHPDTLTVDGDLYINGAWTSPPTVMYANLDSVVHVNGPALVNGVAVLHTDDSQPGSPDATYRKVLVAAKQLQGQFSHVEMKGQKHDAQGRCYSYRSVGQEAQNGALSVMLAPHIIECPEKNSSRMIIIGVTAGVIGGLVIALGVMWLVRDTLQRWAWGRNEDELDLLD